MVKDAGDDFNQMNFLTGTGTCWFCWCKGILSIHNWGIFTPYLKVAPVFLLKQVQGWCQFSVRLEQLPKKIILLGQDVGVIWLHELRGKAFVFIQVDVFRYVPFFCCRQRTEVTSKQLHRRSEGSLNINCDDGQKRFKNCQWGGTRR